MHAKTADERQHDFEQYARFVSGKFSVPIHFDAPRVGSDASGIYLPTLALLDERQLDFLYCSLLREAALWVHSRPDAARAATLATHAQAYITGSLEVARVERLLVRQFDGAAALLGRLHSEFEADPQTSLMALGFMPKEARDWQIFAVALRTQFSPVKENALASMHAKNSQRALQIFSSPSVQALLTAPLGSMSDSFTLGAKLTELFFAGRTDRSGALAFSKEVEQQQLILQELQKARDQFAKEQAAMEAAQQALKQTRADQQPERSLLESQIQTQNEQLASLNRTCEHLDQIAQSAQSVLRKANAFSQTTQKAQNATDKAQQAQNALAAAQQGVHPKQPQSAAAREKFVQKLTELLDKAKARSAAHQVHVNTALTELSQQVQNSLSDLQSGTQDAMSQQAQKELRALLTKAHSQALSSKTPSAASHATEDASDDEGESEAAQAPDAASQSPSCEPSESGTQSLGGTPMPSGMVGTSSTPQGSGSSTSTVGGTPGTLATHTGALSELIKSANDNPAHHSAEQLQAFVSELMKKTSALDDVLRQLRSTISAMSASIGQGQMKALQSAHETSKAAGFGALLPEFEPQPGWDSANALQQEFDAQLSSMHQQTVHNGAGLGTGAREVQVLLQKAQTQTLDLPFTARCQSSMQLSSLAQMAGALGQETLINGQPGAHTSERSQRTAITRHVPASRDFDAVVLSTQPTKNSEFAVLRQAVSPVAARLGRLFTKKLRPSIKSKFKGGQEEGSLDTRSLWKLATGLDTHFMERDIGKPDNKAVASILVDISGSMSQSDLTSYTERLRQLVYILGSALEAVHIKFEVLGYAAKPCPQMSALGASSLYNRRQHALHTVVYKRFADKLGASLMHLEPQSMDNSDSESLAIALTRLKKERAKRHLLFVISDGKPFLPDANIAAMDAALSQEIAKAASCTSLFHLSLDSSQASELWGQVHGTIKSWEDLFSYFDARLDAKQVL